MARPPSQHVQLVKQKLIARLNDGLHRPGSRFMSNRAIAQQYQISYQTAHRLITDLVSEGLLERRPKAGTFVAGEQHGFKRVHLLFNKRAMRADSFGHRLITCLKSALADAGLQVQASLLATDEVVKLSEKFYPILWEVPAMLEATIQWGGHALLLNERVEHGLSSLRIDSISVDDLLGGVMAAEIIASRLPADCKCVIHAGPREDERSQARVNGFRKRLSARVVHAPTWYLDDAEASAARCMRLKPDALFACNDRLAQAVLQYCQDKAIKPPAMIGFDDAPIAETLHISSIAIPWKALAESTTRLVRQRLGGDHASGTDVILRPHPILRLTT